MTADAAPLTFQEASDHVVARLEEAGRTLLALPRSGHSPRLRTSSALANLMLPDPDGSPPQREIAATPQPAAITRMDEAFAWLSRIPQDRFVLRRIVAARALVHPVTGRHLYAWRRLGAAVGADHKAVQRWHGQGIGLIVAALFAHATSAANLLPGTRSRR